MLTVEYYVNGYCIYSDNAPKYTPRLNEFVKINSVTYRVKQILWDALSNTVEIYMEE